MIIPVSPFFEREKTIWFWYKTDNKFTAQPKPMQTLFRFKSMEKEGIHFVARACESAIERGGKS